MSMESGGKKSKKKKSVLLNIILVLIGLMLLGAYMYFYGYRSFPDDITYTQRNQL